MKKKYNDKAIKSTIVTTLSSTIEIHTRKQVHMHSVASQLTKKFSSKLPKSFGESFSYNKVFFALYDGQPVTIDYFYRQCTQTDGSSDNLEIYEKAESLVHYIYITSKKKIML